MFAMSHSICWRKERYIYVVGQYAIHVLFPFLVCASKFLNPNEVGVKKFNFAWQSFLNINLYDFMEIDKKMMLLTIKE
jgi:hypothetical protein